MHNQTKLTLGEIVTTEGRDEKTLEKTIKALADQGEFDSYLPPDSHVRAIRMNGRGKADVEIDYTTMEGRTGTLGVEVKCTSQVNEGKYGGQVYVNQLSKMRLTLDRLLVVAPLRRAAEIQAYVDCEIISLETLAEMIDTSGVTAEQILAA